MAPRATRVQSLNARRSVPCAACKDQQDAEASSRGASPSCEPPIRQVPFTFTENSARQRTLGLPSAPAHRTSPWHSPVPAAVPARLSVVSHVHCCTEGAADAHKRQHEPLDPVAQHALLGRVLRGIPV
eukprot:CAMPEP_0173464622 /NCGR_PEP_ID=MMETSP1357-20121228/70272_1 /TAXON_ID=77926 /ORGANISM="Hemiselmis rufescens, Strain PCC563" /LENGTH=127 /DNA_ID=CAMNT_0014432541 /DNA_START=55 /DNA_END=435 /DNA_ORIENTATION=+